MTQDGSDSRDTAQDGTLQRLDRGAAAVAEGASCVGQWHVDRLCTDSGPGVTEVEAQGALERRGVRVAELPRLPAQPPSAIARHPDFVDLVAGLGRKLSIELVFGNLLTRGFSLLQGIRLDDERRLDRETIEAAAQRQPPPGAHHDDWHRVLSILAAAAQEPRALDDIVFWEVVELLRPLARLDYSQRALTEQAVRLSLERGEAEVLAAAVAEEHEILEPPHPTALAKTRSPGPPADHATAPDLPGEPDPTTVSPFPWKPLQPVIDLQVRTMRGRTDVVQLSWSPPPGGVVSLCIAANPPPWPTGTTIASSDAKSYGEPLSISGISGLDRRMSCELALPQERAFVTAITVRDADAAVGGTVEITRGAPVRGLSWQRFGEEVRLTWIWPDDAIAAHVAWQASAAIEDQHGPSPRRQQRRCSRRAYNAEGGFAALMGRAAQRIEVWAVIAGIGEEHTTAPAEIEVPAIGMPVRYDFRRVPYSINALLSLVRRRRRRELELRLSTDSPCVLPDLIVVECRHQAVPLIPHDDETVVKIPGGPLAPDTPWRIMVELGADGPSWIACFIDPTRPTGGRGRVNLVGPPVARQRVK